jgi:hypothetical protein
MRSALLATAVLSVIATSASADETLKYRTINHITSFQSQPISDADGHLMGVVHADGIATFADGSVASDTSEPSSITLNGLARSYYLTAMLLLVMGRFCL